MLEPRGQITFIKPQSPPKQEEGAREALKENAKLKQFDPEELSSKAEELGKTQEPISV